MSLFAVKMIALSSMLIDHLGVFFFPGNIYFRIIGRLSFPLFAWAIANGAHFTKNINKYLMRILVLAFISQLPYIILFKTYGVDKPGLNILFTLSLGLFGIILLKRFDKLLIQILVILSLSIFAFLTKVDYEAFGILTIIVFYLYYERKTMSGIFYTLLVAAFYLFPLILNKYFVSVFNSPNIYLLELFSPASLFFIACYNRKKGYDLKYLFYIFYPVHLFFIFILTIYLYGF